MSGTADDIPRRYLLRRLSDAEADRFEDRILSEDDCADRVREAEDDLIDDYASDRLSAEERDAVERYLVRSDDSKARLRFARALATISQRPDGVATMADAAAPLGERRSSRAQRWMAPVGLLIAAGLALVVVYVSRQSVPQPTPSASDTGQASLPVDPREAPATIPAAPYAVLLLAEVRRGADRVERIEIPAATELVRLQTEVPDGPSSTGADTSYQIAVRNAEGQELFVSESLAVRQVGAYRIVDAAIPAPRLGVGVRRIEPIRRDGTGKQTLFEWGVEVRVGPATP